LTVACVFVGSKPVRILKSTLIIIGAAQSVTCSARLTLGLLVKALGRDVLSAV
jgi:hypothetical protein